MSFSEFINSIKELLHWLMHRKRLGNPDDLKDFIINFSRLCIVFFVTVCLYYLGEAILFAIENSTSIHDINFILERTEWSQFSIFIVTIIYIVILNYIIIPVRELKEDDELISTRFDAKISSIYSQIISIESGLKNNFKDSFEYFSEWVNPFPTYADFIAKFQLDTKIKVTELVSIADEAGNSINGKFLCVIAYDGYFRLNELTDVHAKLTKKEKEDIIYEEPMEMVQYFGKFDKVTNQNKNHIQRIFTFPGKRNKGNTYITDFQREELYKNHIILQYLIINKVCSVDTYLLIYKKDLDDEGIHRKVLTKCDYVLAYHSLPNSEKNFSQLFFAFPQGSKGKNRALKTEDTFFIKIFEEDFRNRICLKKEDTTPTTLVKFNHSNYDDILRMLNINPLNKAEREATNKQIEKMKDWISRDNSLNQDIVKRIDRWKINVEIK